MYKKDYELLFATRLAAQCTDERVNKVTPTLYSRYPSLEALAEAKLEDVEEIIPGNETYRLECQVVVNLAATSLSAEEIKQLLGAVGKASREVLSEPWRRRALADPRAEFDPEYAAAPFLVLDLFTEVAPPEVSSAGYEGVLAFRAYVQF